MRCRVELGDDGRCLLVQTIRRRVRIPLLDTYFVDPIVALIQAYALEQCSEDGSAEFEIELCGVLVSGRTQLRVRIPGVGDFPQTLTSPTNTQKQPPQQDTSMKLPATQSDECIPHPIW